MKSRKNGKRSGEFFVLKTETSTTFTCILPSEFFQVVKSNLKFWLWRKHSIADREVTDLSYASTASWLLYVHSALWDKLYNLYTKLGSWKKKLAFWKTSGKKFLILQPKICANPVYLRSQVVA